MKRSGTEAAVRRACAEHEVLTGQALLDLAPVAGEGHLAHLHLYAAERQLSSGDRLPGFLARSAQSASLCWETVARLRVDLKLRREFEVRRRVGEVASAHLVALAEPVILRTVRRVLRTRPTSAVVDLDDLVNVGRVAVAQGVWAFDPSSGAGPGFLVQRIEEAVKRELLPAGCGVAVPHRAERRFRRIAAVRNQLCGVLGREPTDEEVLVAAEGALSQADLELERRTRQVRTQCGGAGVEEFAAGGGAEDWVDVDRGVSGWRAVVRMLELDPSTEEVISRIAGLPPFDGLEPEERSERAVAVTTGTTRATVRAAVRRARRRAMDVRGLRAFLAGLPEDDLEGLGLMCFLRQLDRMSA